MAKTIPTTLALLTLLCGAARADTLLLDGIDQAARAGVVAAIQPGGSRNDVEVIAAANEHGMTMIFTGRRHFKH